jgi:hypothetical protein
MNPKTTEFLAQDRIATFRSEAVGHHVAARSTSNRGQAPKAPSAEPATPFALVWRRVRAARTILAAWRPGRSRAASVLDHRGSLREPDPERRSAEVVGPGGPFRL